jgi:hypothetical integral membrane protein (TIGR02206 family)
MSNYFAYDFRGAGFDAYSQQHFYGLLGVAVFIISILIFDRMTRKKYQRVISISMAILLLLQELSLSIIRIHWGVWQVQTSLPLHLCGAAIILSAILLLTRNYRIYEIVYFWALAGAVQALLQPDIIRFGFPHYRYFQFFFSHGMILTTAIYTTLSYGYRPTKTSLLRVAIYTNIYVLAIGAFNLVTGGNYLFICHKPETASIMDVLGPWPLYIIPLEIIGFLSFLFYYAPFFIYDFIQNRNPLPKGGKTGSPHQ